MGVLLGLILFSDLTGGPPPQLRIYTMYVHAHIFVFFCSSVTVFWRGEQAVILEECRFWVEA